MFTVCPKCTLTLSVTAGDLRTGQGYVRCGRCSNVFNALLTLTEQPPDVATSTVPAPAPAPAEPSSAQKLKAPAAAPAEASPSSDVASSVQIDQILMLGGSAFPRPQPASPQRVTKPVVPRAAATPQNKVAPRAPPAVAGARAANVNSTQGAQAPRATPPRSPAGAQPAVAPPKSSVGAVGKEKPVAESEDVTGEFELPRRPPPAARASKPPAPTPPPVSPPQRRTSQNTRVAEEAAASADEAELIERGGADDIEGQTVETIVLEGDGFTQTEEFISEEQAGLAALRREIENLGEERGSSAAASGTRTAERTSSSAAPSRRTRSFRLPRRGSAPGQSSDAESSGPRSAQSTASEPEMGFAPNRQALQYRWAWLSGLVALALLLGFQAINHWRDALATSPSVGPIVAGAYGSLGVTLEPHWDLAAYEVRQQGAQADPKDAHVIHVRLSLANHAARAQPVPVLRLTLLDRYGKRIARRDLAPNEYWPRGHTRQSYLSADQRIDSEVAVRDPNADSASFELDVCLSGRERLHCAMDTAPATANILTP